jgi:putative ABC transport system substrate-binding protein
VVTAFMAQNVTALDGSKALTEIARHVDKVLKGAKLSELPVEQPTRFELAVNLKVAKILEIDFLPSILLRIDRWIQ